jgi:inorganic triphosphatase YgiF
MEREYKWKASAEIQRRMREDTQIADLCTACRELHMQAVYYETADGMLRREQAALRLRRENDSTVCCMKMGKRTVGTCTVREEYETEAADIRDGLRRLPAAGAPAALCEALLHAELRELAHNDFHRTALTLQFESDGAVCTAELALDGGQLGNADAEIAFTEAELEYKDGSTDAFCALAALIAERYALEPQPLSKLARAISAGR